MCFQLTRAPVTVYYAVYHVIFELTNRLTLSALMPQRANDPDPSLRLTACTCICITIYVVTNPSYFVYLPSIHPLYNPHHYIYISSSPTFQHLLQLPKEHTTHAAIKGAKRYSNTHPSHPPLQFPEPRTRALINCAISFCHYVLPEVRLWFQHSIKIVAESTYLQQNNCRTSPDMCLYMPQ